MRIADKVREGEATVEEVQRPRQSTQDAFAEALVCLRWYAKEAGVSFSQAVEESWTGMMHDRLNREDGS